MILKTCVTFPMFQALSILGALYKLARLIFTQPWEAGTIIVSIC